MTEHKPGVDPSINNAGEKRSLSKTLYVHSIAFLGSLFAYVGGFIVGFALPLMVLPNRGEERLWFSVFAVAGVLLGLVFAILSYRATLRVYSKTG